MACQHEHSCKLSKALSKGYSRLYEGDISEPSRLYSQSIMDQLSQGLGYGIILTVMMMMATWI
jgi:hypothetical protein